MNTNTKTRLLYISLGIISIISGLLIYVIFRPGTYVSQIFYKITLFRMPMSPGPNWMGYYPPDFLWALSLTCFLYAIHLPAAKKAHLCSLTTIVVGGVYEFTQYFGFISGTADPADFLLYMLAAVAVDIINYLRRRRNENKKSH